MGVRELTGKGGGRPWRINDDGVSETLSGGTVVSALAPRVSYTVVGQA